MTETNRDIRAIAAIIVIVASAAVLFAGRQLSSTEFSAAGTGVLVLAAALFVVTLGDAPWARATITATGTIGALAAVLGSAADPPSAFYFGSALVLGAAAAALEFTLDRPSTPLAALAAAAPIVVMLDQIGALLLLLGLASCAGVIFDSFRHLWGQYPEEDETYIYEEPVMELQPEDAPPPEPTRQYPPPERSPRSSETTNREVPYITIGERPKLPRSTDVSPPRIEYSAPAGHQFDGFVQRDFIIRGASHVGTAHMQQRRIRQDSYAVGATDDGQFVLAAVADGVGSEPNSSLGAEWSASSAVGVGIDSYDNHERLLSAVEMVQFAADEVGRRARAFGRGTAETDFSTTLIVAVFDCDEAFCQIARVGDSAAFTMNDHEWSPIFQDAAQAPDAPTNAIPTDKPVIEVSELAMSPGQCVLLVSDGIGDLLIHAPDVRREFLGALAVPVSPHQFSAITGFQRRQAHDDQTALCVWRDRSTTFANSAAGAPG